MLRLLTHCSDGGRRLRVCLLVDVSARQAANLGDASRAQTRVLRCDEHANARGSIGLFVKHVWICTAGVLASCRLPLSRRQPAVRVRAGVVSHVLAA